MIATLKARPGKEADVETLLKGLLVPTHAEKGCVRYALHKRIDAPGTWYFVEEWERQSDLDQHLKSAHLQAMKARKEELFSALDVALVEPLPAGHIHKGYLF